MKKQLIATTGALALFAAAATAQTTTSPDVNVKAPGVDVKVARKGGDAAMNPSINYYADTANAWRASKLIGTSVVNNAGETVGDINEIVLDGSGKASAAVIGVGGFLGLGEQEVAVNFDSLKMARDNNGRTVVTLNVTKDSLKAAPQWKWPTT